MRKSFLLNNIIIFLLICIFVYPTYSHPGRTASDGCHYCRTNCDTWGEPWDERHCHGGGSSPVDESPQQVQAQQLIQQPTTYPTQRPIIYPTIKPTKTPTPSPTLTLTPSNIPFPSKILPHTNNSNSQNISSEEKKRGLWEWIISFFN